MKFPAPPRPSIASLAALLGSTVTLAAVYLVLVHTTAGWSVDVAAFQAPRATTLSFGFIDGSLSWFNATSLCVAVVAVSVVGLARGRPWLALAGALTAAAPVLAAHLIRYVIENPGFGDGTVGGSFPSGHTATATAVGMAFVLVSPPSIRGGVALAAAAFSSMVGVELQVHLWHHLVDVLGAGLLSLVVASTAVAALSIRAQGVRSSGHRHWASIAGMMAVAVSAAGIAIAAGARGLDLNGYPASPLEQQNAYLVALATTICVTFLLFAVLLLVSRERGLDGRPMAVARTGSRRRRGDGLSPTPRVGDGRPPPAEWRRSPG